MSARRAIAANLRDTNVKRTFSFVLVGLGTMVIGGCKTDAKSGDPSSSEGAVPVEAPVPPAAPFNATPVSAFADAADLDAKPPLERARIYAESGQLWLARLLIEKQALAPDGTREEAELLARICAQQGDAACVDACGDKLGRKLTIDAGARAPGERPAEHREPVGALAQARDLVLKKNYDEARKLLEPKVLDGKASKEEIRLLKTICTEQADRMCVALCTTKLR